MADGSEPPSSEPTELLLAIGKVTLTWAFLEQGLEGLVDLTLWEFGSRQIDPVRPKEFTRKVRFLRKCLAEVPAFKEAAPELGELLDAAKRLADTRNTIVHGMTTDLGLSVSDVVFRHYDHRVGNMRRWRTTIARMNEAAIEISELAIAVMQIFLRLKPSDPQSDAPNGQRTH